MSKPGGANNDGKPGGTHNPMTKARCRGRQKDIGIQFKNARYAQGRWGPNNVPHSLPPKQFCSAHPLPLSAATTPLTCCRVVKV